MVRCFLILIFIQKKKFVKFTSLFYNTDDYANKLLRKECFVDQDYFSAQDPDQIIPKKYRNYYIDFRAFRPTMIKLESDRIRWYIWILNKLKSFKNKIIKHREIFDLEKSQLALRVVPLPSFNKIKLNYKTY